MTKQQMPNVVPFPSIVETSAAEQRLVEPDEVAQYVAFFDQLYSVAATGPDAAVLIHQVTTELRGHRDVTL